MKYFSPNYWFKLWLLSAPLFNDETIGINAKSINNNEKIKSWDSKNISILDLINQNINQKSIINQPYSLLNQSNQNYLDVQNYENNLTINDKYNYQKKINKRENEKWKENIIEILEELLIDEQNPQFFRDSFQRIIEALINKDILRVHFDVRELEGDTGPYFGRQENSRIFTLNNKIYSHFRIRVNISKRNNVERNIQLVFRTDNLYLEGFLTSSYKGTIDNYYTFNFNKQSDKYKKQYGITKAPHLEKINGFNCIILDEIGPDYRDMISEENRKIGWADVVQSFWELSNENNFSKEKPVGKFAQSLAIVILTTAEALRFRIVYSYIVKNLININDGFINLRRSTAPDENIINDSPIDDINRNLYWFLVNWSSESEFIRDQKPRSYSGRGNGYLNRFSWTLNKYRNDLWTSLEEYMNNRIPLDETTEALRQSTIQILLGKILSKSSKCQNKRNKRKRDLQNNYWNNKFCDLEPEINAIKGTITAIKILDKNKNNNSENWEIYLGTTIGLYFISFDSKIKYFDNLNFPIKDIILDEKNNAYILNNKEEIYHLSLNNFFVKKLNIFKKPIKNILFNDKNNAYFINQTNNKEEIYHFYIGKNIINNTTTTTTEKPATTSTPSTTTTEKPATTSTPSTTTTEKPNKKKEKKAEEKIKKINDKIDDFSSKTKDISSQISNLGSTLGGIAGGIACGAASIATITAAATSLGSIAVTLGGIGAGLGGIASIFKNIFDNDDSSDNCEINFILKEKELEEINLLDISNLIINKNLGIIETNGQDLTEQMIESKLPTSIQNEVDININSNKISATLKPKRNSTKYKGEVIVTYSLDTRKDLKIELAENKRNLTTIETNGQDLTEQMIESKLPTSIQNEVDININSNKISATLKPKRNSTKYKGEVIVTYSLDTRKDLKIELAENKRNLTTIETNGQDLTEQMIESKLPTSIQNEVDININSNKISATLKPKRNSTKYKGEVIVTYSLDTRKDLKIELAENKRNLTTIETNGQDLTEQMIESKLPTSIQNEVDININSNKISATLKPKRNSTKYKGEVIVTYSLDTRKDLKIELAENKRNLTTIETNGQDLTEQMIESKLPTSIQNEVDININSNKISATLKPKRNSTKYKGEVIVTYSLDTRKDLKIELAENKRNLTTIETNGQDLTEQMIESKLPTSIQNEVDININSNKISATLKPKRNSTKYKGEVIVTYSLDTRKDLKIELAENKRNLTTIETNGQDLTEQMIESKLPTSIQNEVDININSNKISATLKPKRNSTKYKGEVIVTYSLDTRKDLKIELAENKRNLTTIETNGQDLTEQMIESKLPTSIQNEVDININLNKISATLKPKRNSTKYKGEVIVTYSLDTRKDLKIELTENKRNLTTIETNGQDLTEQMIESKLPTSIQNEVDININSNKISATLKPKRNSTKYKGEVIVTYSLDTRKDLKIELAENKRNLTTIETNGQDLTEQMIENELIKKTIDISQIDIKINSSTTTTITAKSTPNAKYKGEVIVTYSLDTRKDLKIELAENKRNLTTIETNGQDLTEQMIESKLPTSIQNEVDININSNKISATLTSKRNSTKYKGEVIVTYSLDTRNVIKNFIITGNDVCSSVVVLNNKVYFGSNDGNVYEYDPSSQQSKKVITTGSAVCSSGVVLNNKVYFVSNDGNVYEYDTSSQQSKKVITTDSVVCSSGVVLNNKVYFGSNDGNVYEYDSWSQQSKKVITTDNRFSNSGVVLNNKVYFGSNDGNVYEYDSWSQQSKKVITTGDYFSNSGVVLNNKVYFGSNDGNVYEYDSCSQQSKKVITTGNAVWSSIVVLNNKVYFGSNDGNVYEYDPSSQQSKKVITTGNAVWNSRVVLNNKVYFGLFNGNVYEYDPSSQQSKKVITTGSFVFYSGVVLNNKVYFSSSDGNVYEYDSWSQQSKKVINTGNVMFSSGVVLNNKVYFGSNDGNVYEYDPLKINFDVNKKQKRKITDNNKLKWNNDFSKEINNEQYLSNLENIKSYKNLTSRNY